MNIRPLLTRLMYAAGAVLIAVAVAAVLYTMVLLGVATYRVLMRRARATAPAAVSSTEAGWSGTAGG